MCGAFGIRYSFQLVFIKVFFPEILDWNTYRVYKWRVEKAVVVLAFSYPVYYFLILAKRRY